ncbi:lambda exonuclease family protein [Cohaesibacter celericrescens]|uniref:lambda exonuclease family protein n=1 Tax=Cohaesibacter celericrescens TaxID=2067669 RepID=UPI0035654197
MNDQGTEAWHTDRLGSVTASRISDMLASTKTGWGAGRKNYMAQLVCERLTGQREETFKSPAMERGNEIEDEAARTYAFYHDADVQTVGFIPHPTIPMAGASPDRLVNDDGLIEIKCPNTATHLETFEGASIKRVYMLQMQFQMACTGRKWCDFVSYDPRLPEHLAMHTRRIPRDQEQIAEIEKETKIFLDEVEAKVASLSGFKEAAE